LYHSELTNQTSHQNEAAMLQTNDRALKSRPTPLGSTGTGPTIIKSTSQGPHARGRSAEDVSNRPHSAIYKTMVGLAVSFVVSAWVFFGNASHMGLILAIVCVLFIMAIGIPHILWRAGENETDPTEQAPALGAWIRSDFVTWTGNQTSVTAAVEILLPITAVAVGIMALGIVWAATQ
jgi:hypothetical protein